MIPRPPYAIPVLALAVALATPIAAQQVERRTLAGDEVAIYNLVGQMRVVSGTGSDVVVEVTRVGPDAAKLTIETGPTRGRESLRVIYPDDRIIVPDQSRWSNDNITVRDDGTFFDGHSSMGRRVTISSRGEGLEAHADVRVMVPKGKRVAVYLVAGDATVSNVDGDVLLDVGSATVTTEHTRGRLNLDTGSGEVRITDAQGDVNLDSGSGGVTLDGVKGDELEIDAGSGGLTGANLDVSQLKLDLGSGRTRLSTVRADDIRLDAGSGGIDLGLVSDVRSMIIDAGSGGVTLRLPSSLGAELDIETGSGGIDTDIPLTVTRRSHTHLTGRLGDGDGRIRIEAGSGGVRLLGVRE